MNLMKESGNKTCKRYKICWRVAFNFAGFGLPLDVFVDAERTFNFNAYYYYEHLNIFHKGNILHMTGLQSMGPVPWSKGSVPE